MDREPIYTFAQVRDAAAKYDIRVRLYIFDGGETTEITNARGDQLARLSAMHGDEATAAELAAKWLMDNAAVTVFDFGG